MFRVTRRDILDDPQVQRLPAELFKIWINLNAISNRYGGLIPSLDDAAYLLRLPLNEAEIALNRLDELGLFGRQDGLFKPLKLADRLLIKVGKPLSRAKNKPSRVRVVDNSSGSESEVTPRSKTHETPDPKGSTPLSVISVEKQAVDGWNKLAKSHGLASVQRLTEGRKTHLRARLAEVGIEGFLQAIERVPESAFLLGDNDRGWKADFDFVIRAEPFHKLREGAYARASPVDRGELTREAVRAAAAEADRQEAERKQPSFLGLENGNPDRSAGNRDRPDGEPLVITQEPGEGTEIVREGMRSVF